MTARWGMGKRMALLFAVVYFLLLTLYIPVHFIPIPPIPQLFHQYGSLSRAIVPWVAEHLLRIPMGPPAVTGNGSSDTLYNYVQLLCYVLCAVAMAVVWSLLDRKRPNYQRLETWFRLYLRLVLGITLIQYAVVKFVPAQFPPPSLSTLLEPYGDSSPMHLLWTFMGASTIYTLFAGLAEMLGGVLLFIPRTTTLGALIALGAMSNVLMLNLGYDVPVKSWVFNLVLMSVVLLLPDLKRLADFFVFNRRIEPSPVRPLFRRQRLNQAALALQILFCVVLVAHDLYADHKFAANIAARSNAPLFGIWAVDEFTLDGRLHPPLVTDTERWQHVIIEASDLMSVQSMDGTLRPMVLKLDSENKSLSITRPNNWTWRAEFSYENPRPGLLLLKGQVDGRPVTATLRRVDESKFLLNSRGFRWISEDQFNR